ncbi:hypothetical protein [Gelidibacter japonicus]|uniref:hypothetical protein n=1 Tax=Gelidibacter japonicus TaxID=1962232 RepID=UPI003A958E22
MYKVLWFDDEFDSNKGINIIDNANERNIELIGVTNAKVGIEMLKTSPENYDAILLDGLFFAGDSEKETLNDIAFREVAKIIMQLKAQGTVIPWFVYSGQKEFVKSKNSHQSTFEDENYGNRTYDKINDEDQIDLWNDIIEACNENDDVKIRLKYVDLLKICDDQYIGKRQYKRFFELLRQLEKPSIINNPQDFLNSMRKITEALFDKLNEIGLIPDEVRNGQGGINGSNYFLSCFNSNYDYHNELIHPIVAENIYRLLNITQDGSHNNGHKLRADEYLSSSKYHNLYKSTLYLLLDILEYMKDFIDSNSDRTKNLAKWTLKPIETIHEGIIDQDQDNNYYCDKYHLNYAYVNGKFNVGQKIKIVQEDINTNPKTKHLYSHYAVKFETIN